MPRGIRKQPDGIIGEPMTKDELKAVAERAENQVSPMPEITPASGQEVPIPGNPFTKRMVVGMQGTALGPQSVGDSQTLKKFARKKIDFRGWVPATEEDVREWQRKGILIGHDPDKKLALIKEE